MRSFSKLAAYSAIGALSAFIAGSAAASTWTHNGSKVSFEENGNKRRIVFTEPRANLEKAGVKRGTVLFEGETKKNGRLSGYAKLFKAGCDPLDYFVEGSVDTNKGEIVLQGQAPVFSKDGCKIQGYSEDSAASTLAFASAGGGRGNYASGYDQGDGNYNRGQQGAQEYLRDGRGSASGYASNSGRNDDGAESGGGNSGADQYGGRNDDPRYAAGGNQPAPQDDQRFPYRNQRERIEDERDPRYAQRGTLYDRDDYDPRHDRYESEYQNDDEETTYRYRYRHRRSFDQWNSR